MKKLIILSLAVLLLTGCNPFKKDQAGGGLGQKTYTYQSLKAAVALGIPLKCSYKINDLEYEGYLKGKQWRGKMSQMGKTTNVIMKDNCMYMWSDDTTQGAQMCFEEDIWNSEDYEQYEQPGMEYTCRPAVIGDDQFTPPSSIEFLDLMDPNSMMQGMPSAIPQQMPEEMPSEDELPEGFPTDEMMKQGMPQ